MPGTPRDSPPVKRALLATLLAPAAFAADALIPATIEFNRDVRPILADTCFRCHGFDKNTREADLRLDTREAAIAKIDGIFPIVPGKPEQSEAWKRITTKDEDDIMPPKKANRQLSDREKEVIRKWIGQGAEYQPHWAYIAPVKPDVAALVKAHAVPVASGANPATLCAVCDRLPILKTTASADIERVMSGSVEGTLARS